MRLPRGKTVLRWFLILVVGPIVIGFVMMGWAAGRHEKPQQVAEGVFRVRNLMVDLYAARAGDGVVMFDAGLDARGRPGDDLLGALSARRQDLRALFLTHAHPDHAGAASSYKGVTVYVGAGDAALLAGTGGKNAGAARVWRRAFGIPTASAGDLVAGRREVAVGGGQSVLCLPFPGHTAGSTLYLFHGVLFVGDAFQYDGTALQFSPEKFSDDPAQARRSIAGLPQLLKGLTLTTVCTGHGGCTPPDRTPALIDDLVRRAGAG